MAGNNLIVTNTDSIESGFPKVTGTTSGTKHALDVSVIASGNLLEGVVYDYISASYPDSVTEIYTFKDGGSGGTTTATITIVYTSATKQLISTAART